MQSVLILCWCLVLSQYFGILMSLLRNDQLSCFAPAGKNDGSVMSSRYHWVALNCHLIFFNFQWPCNKCRSSYIATLCLGIISQSCYKSWAMAGGHGWWFTLFGTKKLNLRFKWTQIECAEVHIYSGPQGKQMNGCVCWAQSRSFSPLWNNWISISTSNLWVVSDAYFLWNYHNLLRKEWDRTTTPCFIQMMFIVMTSYYWTLRILKLILWYFLGVCCRQFEFCLNKHHVCHSWQWLFIGIYECVICIICMIKSSDQLKWKLLRYDVFYWLKSVVEMS